MAEDSTSASFNCLHPTTVEQRGSVKMDGEETFKVTLKDCLACSGCAITEDEITIISAQNTSKIFEKINEDLDFAVIVSTECVANLAAIRNWSAGKALAAIKQLFDNKGAKLVVLDTEIVEIWRKLLIKEFIEKDCPSPFLISRCAGSVIYYQRKTTYGPNLAQIKPYPQLFADYLKKVEKIASYVIYVGPCYDRKLEAAHFENDVDAVLTIGELNEYIEDIEKEEAVTFPAGNDAEYMVNVLKTMQTLNEYELINYVREFEPTLSDGELEQLCNDIPKRVGNEEIKSGIYQGEAANKRFTNMIKKGKPCQRVCLVDYCKGGCCTGGGLIKGESPKERKELIEKTNTIHKENEGEIEVSPDLYQKIIEMGYSTLYESTKQEQEDNQFLW